MARILVADDEADLRAFLVEALEDAGHEVVGVGDGASALRAARASHFDVVLTDLRMPRTPGQEVVRVLRLEQPDTQVVVLTAYGRVQTAVDAMKQGAFDFLEKPIASPAALREVVARALAAGGHVESHAADEPIWTAPAMVPVVDALRKVAGTEATVLLTGESGTGKEVAARAVHRWSRRASGPFAAVNCAALSEELLESELFGHEQGAFTGAVRRRRGRIELAAGGSFFLDEVGELKPALQARLLRVLQERRFERVGGHELLSADVRWIAATNRDLGEMVAAGTFREDLYHRLAVFPVSLPPLRARREDIWPLALHLLGQVITEVGRPDLTLAPELRPLLEGASWPGNVRELRNVLSRAAILVDGVVIGPVHVSVDGGTAAPSSAAPPTMAGAERAAIVQALALHDGHRKKAAEHLGIGLRTLYEKLKRYDIR